MKALPKQSISLADCLLNLSRQAQLHVAHFANDLSNAERGAGCIEVEAMGRTA